MLLHFSSHSTVAHEIAARLIEWGVAVRIPGLPPIQSSEISRLSWWLLSLPSIDFTLLSLLSLTRLRRDSAFKEWFQARSKPEIAVSRFLTGPQKRELGAPNMGTPGTHSLLRKRLPSRYVYWHQARQRSRKWRSWHRGDLALRKPSLKAAINKKMRRGQFGRQEAPSRTRIWPQRSKFLSLPTPLWPFVTRVKREGRQTGRQAGRQEGRKARSVSLSPEVQVREVFEEADERKVFKKQQEPRKEISFSLAHCDVTFLYFSFKLKPPPGATNEKVVM